MKKIVPNIAIAIEKELPPNHGFLAVIVPMDKMETTRTGVASNLQPEQTIEVLEGLLNAMKSKQFKPKDLIN